MKKLWRLFPVFISFTAKREVEFRFNFMFFLIFDLLWIGTSLLGVILTFRQAGTVAGWRQHEAVLLVLVYYLTGSIIKSMVIPAAEELSELIRLGKLDLYLSKPVGLRSLIMFSQINAHELVRFPLMIFLVPWYLGKYQIMVLPTQWMGFIFISVITLIAFFEVYFAIAAMSFWLQNTFNLGDFFRETLDVSKRPVDIFPNALRQIATFVVPVGLVSTIPTKVLLGQVHMTDLLLGLGAVAAVAVVASLFFQFSLRYYSSASS